MRCSLLVCALAIGCSPTLTDRRAEVEAKTLLLVEPRAEVKAPHVVITNATVMDANGHVWPQGWIELRDGRIAALGEGAPLGVMDAKVIDAKGHFVTPGVIDVHSHL